MVRKTKTKRKRLNNFQSRWVTKGVKYKNGLGDPYKLREGMSGRTKIQIHFFMDKTPQRVA